MVLKSLQVGSSRPDSSTVVITFDYGCPRTVTGGISIVHRLPRPGEQQVRGLVGHAVEVAVEHCPEHRIVGVGSVE